MNGFDVAKYQGNISGNVPGDFCIIKATQSTSYVNSYLEIQYNNMKKAGKLLGLYHYAGGGNGAINEAKHFLSTVKNKIGEAILILDWESDMNPKFNDNEYAKMFLKYIIKETGIIPFLYISKSVCRSQDWSDIASTIPLWVAQYPSNNYKISTGYKTNPWTDNKGFGPWKSPKIFQYSSNGKLDNYLGPLDLDLAYMNKSEWLSYTKKKENNNIEKFPKQVKIINGSLNIRDNSNVSAKDIGDLVANDTLTVYTKENGFYWFEGWISSNQSYSILINENQVRITANSLSVRNKSNSNSNVLGYVRKNTVISFDKIENGWYHILGWFSGKTSYTKEL